MLHETGVCIHNQYYLRTGVVDSGPASIVVLVLTIVVVPILIGIVSILRTWVPSKRQPRNHHKSDHKHIHDTCKQ